MRAGGGRGGAGGWGKPSRPAAGASVPAGARNPSNLPVFKLPNRTRTPPAPEDDRALLKRQRAALRFLGELAAARVVVDPTPLLGIVRDLVGGLAHV